MLIFPADKNGESMTAPTEEKLRKAQLELVALILDDDGIPNAELVKLAEEYKADVLAGRITSSK